MKFLKIIVVCLVIGCGSTDSNEYADAYNRTSRALKADSIDQALSYCQVAVEKSTNASELGQSYWMMGYLYDLLDDAANAQNYYVASADAYLYDGNTKNAVMLLQNAGTIALNADAYKVAIEYYRSRLKHAEEINDTYHIAVGNYELGLAFLKDRQLDSANTYQNNVIDLTDDKDSLAAKAYLDLGIIQFHLKNYDSARFLYNKTLSKYSSKVLEYKVAQNIANSYLEEADYQNAETSLRESLAKGRVLGTNRSIIKPINGLGQLFAEQNQNDSAIHYLSMVYELSKSYENANDRKKLYAMGLSRSPLHDLGSNYTLLREIDPELATKIAEEYIMEHMMDYLNSMEVMAKQEQVRAIQLANANRNESRLLKKLDQYRKAELRKNIVIGICIVAIITLILSILWNRIETISNAKEVIRASQSRLKKLNS